MTYDDKQNLIEVCLFESYLAQYFLEHPDIFKPLITKILDALETIVDSNSDNRTLNRVLFSVFSTLSEINPGIQDFSSLRHSNDLTAFDTFLKYFIERVMRSQLLKIPPLSIDQSDQIAPLSVLAQCALFSNPAKGEALISEKLRPKALFLDKNRGVVEIPAQGYPLETRHLGILSCKDTPAALKNYFTVTHAPCRQYYRAQQGSLMGQWLRRHHLPIISGASGGMGKTVSKLSALAPFSKKEYQLLGLLIASSTIALGHHSFFEVMRPLSFYTGALLPKDNLLQFYEQTIPADIKSLPSYKAHMNSAEGFELIKELVFDQPAEDAAAYCL